MSFPRYPKYKHSGVEWLGEVPEGWEVTALKRGFDVTLGKMLQPESKSPDDELLPYLRAANIQWGGVDTADIKQMWFTKRDRAQLQLEVGDLLVSEGGDVGRSCLWAGELEDCYFQNSVNRVRAHDSHSNNYLRYWISTIKDKGYIDVLCNKSTIAHFTAEKVASVPIPLPPPPEQTAIAAFLDRETAKIDALVAEQRRLIDLLKEKRQAVISHAVTKGLNPDVPMKDSGVEWLGEVPAHWESFALKFLASLKSGDSITSESIEESGEYPVFGGNGLRGFTSAFTHEGRYVLIGRQGALCGNINYAEGQFWASEHAVVAAPKLECDTTWLGELLRTMNLNQYSVSAAQPGLSVDIISNLTIPVPPLSEQISIASYINSETAKLDTLTAEAQRAIDLLQERRTALISAAVTGQIDVRHLTERKSA
jgi:type I restriction enzyme, S subunit